MVPSLRKLKRKATGGARGPRYSSGSAQRLEVDPAEEDLGALGLEEELALGVAAPGAHVDHGAVQEGRGLVAVADTLQAVPLADGLLDVLLAAEALDITPGGIATEPVDATGTEVPRGRTRLVVGLIALLVARDGWPVLRFDGDGRLLLAPDEDDVSRASFDHLALDRLHPGPAGGAILADTVQQDTAVARRLLTGRPCFFSPFELHD